MSAAKACALCLGMLGVFFTTRGRVSADSVDPYLADILRDTSVVDTTSSSQSIVVELRAIDEFIDGDSGIDNGGVIWQSPSGSETVGFGFYPAWNLVSGDIYDGVYGFSVTFPQFSEAGVWLPRVDLRDEGGNSVLYHNADLIAMGFSDLAVTVTSSTPDVTAPQLIDVARDVSTVDTTTAEQTVNVTTHVSDDLSGLDFGGVTWKSPSGSQFAGFGFYPESNLISGDANDGTYEFPVTFKQYCEPGTWLPVVDLQDEIGNDVLYSHDKLVAMGFDDLAVEVTCSKPDVTSPEIVDLASDLRRVVTWDSDQTVMVRSRVTDDLSGFDTGGVTWRSPSGSEIAGFGFGFDWNLVSGDGNDGIYEFSVTFEQGCEQGVWLPVVDLQDVIGNDVFYDTSEMAALGLSLEIEVCSLPGDANRDGVVDEDDAELLASNWQTIGTAVWEEGDFNYDGNVDEADATLLAANWQEGAVAEAAVPEPGMLALLGVGIFMDRC